MALLGAIDAMDAIASNQRLRLEQSSARVAQINRNRQAAISCRGVQSQVDNSTLTPAPRAVQYQITSPVPFYGPDSSPDLSAYSSRNRLQSVQLQQAEQSTFLNSQTSQAHQHLTPKQHDERSTIPVQQHQSRAESESLQRREMVVQLREHEERLALMKAEHDTHIRKAQGLQQQSPPPTAAIRSDLSTAVHEQQHAIAELNSQLKHIQLLQASRVGNRQLPAHVVHSHSKATLDEVHQSLAALQEQLATVRLVRGDPRAPPLARAVLDICTEMESLTPDLGHIRRPR